MIIPDDVKHQLFVNSKDLWLSALFSNIHGYYPDISFIEQKDIFFMLVDEWLAEGKIKLNYPHLLQYEGKEGFWEEDTQVILQFLLDTFPINAHDRYDDEVNSYFFEIVPAVSWLQADGTYGEHQKEEFDFSIETKNLTYDMTP